MQIIKGVRQAFISVRRTGYSLLSCRLPKGYCQYSKNQLILCFCSDLLRFKHGNEFPSAINTRKRFILGGKG